ncbi:hypothetical protein MOUN0_A05710 [Monosporozyma unispora]
MSRNSKNNFKYDENEKENSKSHQFFRSLGKIGINHSTKRIHDDKSSTTDLPTTYKSNERSVDIFNMDVATNNLLSFEDVMPSSLLTYFNFIGAAITGVENTRLQQLIDDLRQELYDTFLKHRNQMEDFQKEKSELRKQLSDLREEMDRKLTALRREYEDEMEKKVSTLKREHKSEMNSMATVLRRECKNEMDAKVIDLRIEHQKEMDEKVTALRTEHEKEMAQKEKEMAQKEKEMAQKEKEAKEYRNNEINSLRQEVNSLSASNMALYRQLEQIRREYNESLATLYSQLNHQIASRGESN